VIAKDKQRTKGKGAKENQQVKAKKKQQKQQIRATRQVLGKTKEPISIAKRKDRRSVW
jgi:hypothetical protein